MTFEEQFLPNDVALAKVTFHNLIESLKIIDHFLKKGDELNAKQMTNVLIDSLSVLNNLASRKGASTEMHLHHLLNQPQRWYPN